jgi:osmoprotectant transport system permease protein
MASPVAFTLVIPLASDADSLIWWDYVRRHSDDYAEAVGRHLTLTVVAVAGGLLVSIPLALLARRYRGLAGAILAVSGVLYTIPSIALLYLLGPLTGFTSFSTVEIALITYTVLILVRNILTGLESVSDDVKEAARGMGYTDRALLWKVEVPLALPSIVAGIRIATVTTIGLASLAALLTQGGLGVIILDGIQRQFPTQLMIGSILVILLAVIADLVLLILQRLVSPWSRTRRTA